VRYFINIGAAGPGRDPRTMAALAALAEASGWDGVLLEDYLVYQNQVGTPTYDPWVTLAAMAVATTRILLGTLVTPLPRRRPWKLASEAVTLDHLSGGRVILGVGAGDAHDPSFAAAGEPSSPTRWRPHLTFHGSRGCATTERSAPTCSTAYLRAPLLGVPWRGPQTRCWRS